MIIDFNRYNGGGGSGSGVTPQEVQRQIDSALTPYWESGETKDYVDEAISGISLEGYYTSAETDSAISQAVAPFYTSAQTDAAISAATSGKADAANLSTGDTNPGELWFPKWNEQGIITGKTGMRNYQIIFDVNGTRNMVTSPDTGYIPSIYAPRNAGTAGDILVSVGGNQAPIWSAVTMPDMSEYTPTSGFSTINGSAITNGGNIEIQGGGDMSGYWNSAETKSYADSAATIAYDSATTHIEDIEQVVSSALNEFHEQIMELSARTPDLSAFYTSAQTEEAIASAITPVQSAVSVMDEVVSQALVDLNTRVDALSAASPDLSSFYTSAQTMSAISAATENLVDSSEEYLLPQVRHIVAIDQASYDDLVANDEVDPNTFYIIVEQI